MPPCTCIKAKKSRKGKSKKEEAAAATLQRAEMLFLLSFSLSLFPWPVRKTSAVEKEGESKAKATFAYVGGEGEISSSPFAQTAFVFLQIAFEKIESERGVKKGMLGFKQCRREKKALFCAKPMWMWHLNLFPPSIFCAKWKGIVYLSLNFAFLC